LFGGKVGVLGLGNGTAEYIKDAGVLLYTGQIAKPEVECVGISPSEIGDRPDAEEVEIGEHRFSDAPQIT
jgi:hypothetical protein